MVLVPSRGAPPSIRRPPPHSHNHRHLGRLPDGVLPNTDSTRPEPGPYRNHQEKRLGVRGGPGVQSATSGPISAGPLLRDSRGSVKPRRSRLVVASETVLWHYVAIDRWPSIRQLWSGGPMRAILAARSADRAIEDAERSGFRFSSNPKERGASRCGIPRTRADRPASQARSAARRRPADSARWGSGDFATW